MSEIDLRFDATDDGTTPTGRQRPRARRGDDTGDDTADGSEPGSGVAGAVGVARPVDAPGDDPGPAVDGDPAGARPLGRLPRPLGNRLSLEGAAAALRALPYGGVDDGALSLRLPPAVHATISPVVAALRWGAVMFAMVSAVTRANKGDYGVVSAVSVVLFLTTWRTLRPIRLGSDRWRDRGLAISDTVWVGLAVGWSGAFSSPFIFCALACAAVGAFGWGLRAGLGLTAVAGVAMAVGSVFGDDGFAPFRGQAPAIIASIVLAVALIGFARARLLEAERRRANLAGQLDLLTDTNDLLRILNQLARTLPQSLDLREAMARAREELQRTFDADVVALVAFDEGTGEWTPHITDGCAMRPSATTADLPPRLAEAVEAERAVLSASLLAGTGLAPRSGSGVYAAIRARDRVIGVLGVEHRVPDSFGPRHARLMDGLTDVLALTLDNARSFRRLRMLGADEERSRIARDLHDRLGQWLSYISFELERIITTSDGSSGELDRLYADVQTAIGELRETLRQLRSEVTEERSFAVVARELVDRFNARADSEASATLTVAHPEARLAPRIENELLRVLQEALSNVAKHARASTVDITWDVADGAATLTVADDGVGFDTDRGVRDSAFGLVGMRERADVAGARLSVASTPGQGTTITVKAGRIWEETSS
jgi:signal transduction histidine kinase